MAVRLGTPADDKTNTVHKHKVSAEFTPAWWLQGGNRQTLWPALVRRIPATPVSQERFPLPDGDWINLYWGPSRKGPLILILHGLGGCGKSVYTRGMLHALTRHGFQCLIMEFRGASSMPNCSDRFYHAASWEDVRSVVTELGVRYPKHRIGVVGFSLGGSIVLNWLIADPSAPIDAAAAISVPFDLAICARTLDRGFARLYQRNLLFHLKQRLRNKYQMPSEAPVSLLQLAKIRSLFEFDNRITAPLHGFVDAADYYRRCSCGPKLEAIKHPSLIIHADDDPLAPLSSTVRLQKLSSEVLFEITRGGGHVGFVQGSFPGHAVYWAEQRVCAFLMSVLF